VAVVVAMCAGCGGGRTPPGRQMPSGMPLVGPTPVYSSGFGMRNGRLHAGADLVVPKGTKVVSTARGRVTFAGKQRGYGKIVIIEHADGYETRYAHLDAIKTGVGKLVDQGDIVGRVGKTGNATTHHLHYEVRRNGQPRDPTPYLL